MERFLNSKNYKEMKAKYEKEYFKLGGEYAWYDGDKITNKSTSKISEHFKNKKVIIHIEKENEDGDTVVTKKEKSFYQVWSEDPKMKEYNEVVFDCNLKNVKDYQFNLYDGFAIAKEYFPNIDPRESADPFVKAKEGLKLINNHISILCNHNEDHIKLVKYFYGQALQQPHILPNFCLVFISKEGVGKDVFFELIELLFGEKYCFNVDKLESIVGKFNTTCGGKIMGVINETDPIDSQKRRESIKFFVTAKKVLIEGKYKEPVKAPNYCRMTFFSNRISAFPVEHGARRPHIIPSSCEKLTKYIGAEENKKYFDALVEAINNKYVRKLFYDELMKIDIAKFNHKEIDKSELHKTLEDAAKSPMVEFLCQIVYKNNKTELYKQKSVKLLKDYTEFMKERNMKFEVSQKAFNSDLQHEFKARKFESCGINKFEINIKNLKTILEEEYNCKFNFDDEDEIDDEEYNNGIDKSDKSIKMSLDDKIEHLTKELEKLKKLKAEENTKASYFGKVSINHKIEEEEDEKPVKKPKNGRLLQVTEKTPDLDVNEIPDPFSGFRD